MSSGQTENPPLDAKVAAAPVVGGGAVPDTTLSDAIVTVRKRKWIILAFALVGAAYGWYQGSLQPRLYSSAGTIEIRSGASNQYRVGAGGTGGTDASFRLPTEVAILKSDSLMLAVARDLNLANNVDFMGPSTGFRNIDDPAVRQNVISALQGAIGVGSIVRTDLVSINCSTLNAQLSANIINKLVDEYRIYSFQTRADATKRVTEFFANNLDELRKKVEDSQEAMIDLQKHLGVLGFDPALNQVTSELGTLNSAVGASEIANIQAETQYKILAGAAPDLIDQSGGNVAGGAKIGVVAGLRGQIEGDQATLATLSATLGPNNPRVVALNDRIAELQKQIDFEQQRILTESRLSYQASQAAEQQTKGALNNAQSDASKLRDYLLQYTLRQRDYESNRTIYEGLEQRLRTAAVEAGLESTEIDIVDPAVPALSPTLKPISSIAVVDGAIMAVVGIILAFILDSLDTGLSSVTDIENISGLPSLALIPRGRRIAAESGNGNLSPAMRNLGTLTSPKSQFSEAFRALRTSLLLSIAGGEPKVILLTSSTPSEGKTTVSINLACVLAQRNVRVLLIDADLRRPTVHHRFGLNGKVGLTSVLTGSLPLEDVIQNVPEIPMLDVLVSGPVPPFPTEMLGSQTMRDLLEKCKGIYSHIVLDSPPLLSVTDSVVLARDSDAVVLIVRHGKSSKHAVRRGRDLLQRAGATVTGIVLNAVDLNSPEYYAYYGYYGYSGYGAAGVDSAGWEAKSESAKADKSRRGDAE
jgi:succinoglycan biosynthesis transport protein ExoP